MGSPSETANPPVESVRRAVIDVGSNSVKLLVAEVSGSEVRPCVEVGEQTRLGQGFFETRRLRPDAIARTAAIVAAFRSEAAAHGARSVRVLGTAAAREAVNAEELLAALRNIAGTELEVVSGEREAEMAFRGVCTDHRLADDRLLVTDVGGGSTEFVIGRGGVRRFGRSFPLGAVRLLESIKPSDRPGPVELERCRAQVRTFLQDHVAGPVSAARAAEEGALRWVGVGGTAVILARISQGMKDYDRSRIEGTLLSGAALTRMTEHLWSLSLEERRQVIGLPPERADIILTGSVIYEGILRVLDFGWLEPSTRGLRFAALIEDE